MSNEYIKITNPEGARKFAFALINQVLNPRIIFYKNNKEKSKFELEQIKQNNRQFAKHSPIVQHVADLIQIPEEQLREKILKKNQPNR